MLAYDYAYSSALQVYGGKDPKSSTGYQPLHSG
jgi:hypothetical protein